MQLFNISQVVIHNKTQFVPNGLNMTAQNTSLTIELYPLNVNTGYLILLKWGDTPYLNSSYNNIDTWQMLCPQGKPVATVLERKLRACFSSRASGCQI